MVRISARHGQVTSFGSGTLIAKKTNYGFVITNWHVVRDSSGYVTVGFPDHRDYEAAVVAVDDRWDLALLVIAEPKGVEPVVISPTIPKIGDYYWVAGYRGDGTYLIQGGRCKAFQQPEPINIEAELIEISVPSENGCSGGPVFNAKKELVGVLFGSDHATTMASHCGRVIKFLEQAAPHVASLPARPDAVIKAASLSQKSIVQRGAITLGSSASLGSNDRTSPSAGISSSVSTSSSSFGGSGIRARGNVQPAESQQLTRLERYGFMSLQYDISAANTLLATESRSGANIQNTTSQSGSVFPASVTSTLSQTTAQPASPATFGNNHTSGYPSASTSTASVSDYSMRLSQSTKISQPTDISQTSSRATNNTTVTTPLSGYSGTSSPPTGTPNASNSPAVRATQTDQSTQSSDFRTRLGTAEVSPASTAETIPGSVSRSASTTPTYGNKTNGGSNNSGSVTGRANSQTTGSQVSGNQVTGNTSYSAAGSFDGTLQRKTETTPGGTRGTTSGGQPTPSSMNYSTYSQNTTSTPNPSQSTASQNTTRGSTLWSDDDNASMYVLDISDMQAGDNSPKYAEEFDADPAGPNITGAGSKFDAIKIVIAILVIFFILFHTIKTMAYAEERQMR